MNPQKPNLLIHVFKLIVIEVFPRARFPIVDLFATDNQGGSVISNISESARRKVRTSTADESNSL